MKCRVILLFLIGISSINLFAQYTNILIGNQAGPNEPSIAMDPGNPAILVAGANNDKFYYSSNGGADWNAGVLTSSYGVAGDPVVICDTLGSFYYLHLSVPDWTSWLDRIVCQRSDDHGATWSDGSYMGLNGSKDQDKQWAVVDPFTNIIHAAWTQFDQYGSTNPYDSSHIMYSRSTDRGVTWSPAQRLDLRGGNCHDDDNTVEGATLATGPNGEVYIAWMGPEGLVFRKSTDGGVTWPQQNSVILDIPGGWDIMIPGIMRCNGFPVIACDLSGGPQHGTLYINWSDQRNGDSDTDVWLIQSSDGGETWSQPARVNDDPPGKHQFFTWMALDQSNGDLWFVFFDRRNYSGDETDVWMAVSKDGGDTFSNFKISESPFTPVASVFFGDYNNLAVHSGIVRPVWTRLEDGQLSLWTALIDSVNVGVTPVKESFPPFSLEQNYPNPAFGTTWISFRIRQPEIICLRVFNASGQLVGTLIDREYYLPGKYTISFNPSDKGLTKGFYWYSLTGGNQSLHRKLLIE